MIALYSDTAVNKKSLISVQCYVFKKQKKRDGYNCRKIFIKWLKVKSFSTLFNHTFSECY